MLLFRMLFLLSSRLRVSLSQSWLRHMKLSEDRKWSPFAERSRVVGSWPGWPKIVRVWDYIEPLARSREEPNCVIGYRDRMPSMTPSLKLFLLLFDLIEFVFFFEVFLFFYLNDFESKEVWDYRSATRDFTMESYSLPISDLLLARKPKVLT